VVRPTLLTATPVPPASQSSSSAMAPLAAGSELGDELLGFVQLAAESVPPLGRALRERPARVAAVQLADRGTALPLPGPELPYGRPTALACDLRFPVSVSASRVP
jgi:hypothetical protein